MATASHHGVNAYDACIVTQSVVRDLGYASFIVDHDSHGREDSFAVIVVNDGSIRQTVDRLYETNFLTEDNKAEQLQMAFKTFVESAYCKR